MIFLTSRFAPWWPGLMLVTVTGIAAAQDDPGATPGDSQQAILADQQQIAEDYRLLEEKLFSLYQFEQDQNPERARLLQTAYQQSREKLTLAEIEEAVRLLQQSRLRDAEKKQATTVAHLEQLLEMLQSGDRGQRIREDQERYGDYLREVDRMLRIQQGIRGRAENGDSDSTGLSDQQQRLRSQAAELGQRMAGEPGGGRAAEQDGPGPLEAAEQNMQRAIAALKQAQRRQSVEEMRQAERELARAREQLESTLRQLREEEVERSLASLESRFRRMLELQLTIHTDTLEVDGRFAGQRDPLHDMESTRLAARQRELVTEAERARLVLEDDGSTSATIETVSQLSVDLQQASDRLAVTRTGQLTRQIQLDSIETLGFLVEAFEQAQRDADEAGQASPQDGGNGEAGRQALVNHLAELKLIRGLQSRILNRHRQYAARLPRSDDPVGFSADPETVPALQQLSERQRRLQQVAADMVAEEKRRAAAPGDQ